MTEMEEIFRLEDLKRRPPDLGFNVPHCILELALTLSSRQRSLMAEVIRVAEESEDFDVLRQCLISPATYSEDLRQAQWAVHRYQDGQLYSKHTQGPDQPTEPAPWS